MKKVYLLVSAIAMGTFVSAQHKTEVYDYSLPKKLTNVLDRKVPATVVKVATTDIEKSITAIWSEDFTVTTPLNTANGTWVVGGTNSTYWTVGSTHPMSGFTDNLTGSYLIWNSYGPNASETNFATTPVSGEIVSPTIDLSSLTNGAMLSFKTEAMYCCHTSEIPFRIAVSENDGSTWSSPITLDFGVDRNTATEDLAHPMTINVDLSSVTTGFSATSKIKFIWEGTGVDGNGQSNTHYFWMLDDLQLYDKLNYDLVLEKLWLNDITTGYEHTDIPQSFAGNLTVQGKIRNDGKLIPSNTQVVVSVYSNTGALITSETGGVLANNLSGVYDTITFASTIDLSALPISDYSIKADLISTQTDLNPENDSLRRILYITDFYLGQRTYEATRIVESAGRSFGTATNYDPMTVGNVFSIPAGMSVDLQGLEITLGKTATYGITAGTELTVKIYTRDYSAASYDDSFLDQTYDIIYKIKSSDIPATNNYKNLLINFNNDGNSFYTLEGGVDYFIGVSHLGGTEKMSYAANLLDDDNSSVIMGAFASTAGDHFFTNGNQINARLNFNPALIVEAGVNELSNSVGLAIYPNPATTQANVSFNLKAEANVVISITDLTGKTVYTNDLGATTSGAHKVTVNTDSLSNGVYMVNVNSNGTVSTQKLVVRK